MLTLQWQLKPKATMGSAKSAERSQRMSGTPSSGSGHRAAARRAPSTRITPHVYTNPTTASVESHARWPMRLRAARWVQAHSVPRWV